MIIIQTADSLLRRINRIVIFAAINLLLTAALSAQQEKIPLIISDHHADHLEFFRISAKGSDAVMVVLDAHADTVANDPRNPVTTGNHNWIHPLSFTFVPLETIAFINVIRGSPRHDITEGFYRDISSWTSWNKRVRGYSLKLDELRYWDIINENSVDRTLFISVDLDFFYSYDHTPQDVPLVLNILFDFSSRWQGNVVWGICLSRPWLPNDNYAWTLLDRTFVWLSSRPEFDIPKITLFDNSRTDTSRLARWYYENGKPIPYLREEDASENIKTLIRQLTNKKDLNM